jgi:hypothetical protein
MMLNALHSTTLCAHDDSLPTQMPQAHRAGQDRKLLDAGRNTAQRLTNVA